jgi:MFS family permease
MELDELKQKWAEHDRKLETGIRLNHQLAREIYTGRARSRLSWMAAILGLGAIVQLAVIMWLGAFTYDHWGKPQFLWPSLALDVLAIATLIVMIAQIALAVQTDYGQPVATIQRRLEMLRRLRIFYTQALIVLSPLAWVPMFMVAAEALFRVDVYSTFDRAWLIGNVVFGLAFIPLAIWLARRYARRFEDQLVGRNLQSASQFIAALAEFEREN